MSLIPLRVVVWPVDTVEPVAAQQRRSLAEWQWIPPGQHTRIAGYDIPGGLIYVGRHLRSITGGVEPALITELVGLEGDEAVFNERHRQKQPDWTYNAEDSGKWPAERLDEHRAPQRLED